MMKIGKIQSFYNNRKVLVVGGAGFIGSNLSLKLTEYGSRVTIVDNLNKDCGGKLFNMSPIKNKIVFLKCDVNFLTSLNKVLKNTEIVFNCMGYTNHLASLKDPEKDWHYNCLSHLKFLNKCKECNNVRLKIVYLGSRSQYGLARQKMVCEDHPMYPRDFHSAHKTLGEYYHFLFNLNFGLKTVILRLTNVYGPRQDMRPGCASILNSFIRDIIEGRIARIFGIGNRLKDFLYVEDAVQAALLAGAGHIFDGQAFNVGGNPLKIEDAVKLIIKIFGRGSYEIVPFPGEIKKIDTGDMILDSRKIEKQLGWQSQTVLKNGLEESIKFYLENKRYYW